MPFYEKGNVRIRYEEVGSGIPLLAIPGGGLNSKVSNWPNAVFNSMAEFKNDFRVITMDQRNAVGGESTGPVPADKPWDAFADDQLGLMDHLGIREFFFIGYCIGGPFGLKLIERAPDRVMACVCVQPVGCRTEDTEVMYRHSRDNWAAAFRKDHPEVSEATIEKYLRTMWCAQPSFVQSVTMDFARTIKTPILVLPDETPSHPYQTSIEIASLCPNADITVFPWREPADLKARTIDKVRRFLKAHVPMKAAAD